MRISVYEQPLPQDQHEAERAIFELQCPALLSAWRDTTARILVELGRCTTEGKKASPFLQIGQYQPLQKWSFTSGDVTIGSRTKSFMRSHYNQTELSTPDTGI